MTVALTSGTIETSIATTTQALPCSGGGGSTSSTKDDPLYTRYLIKTLSSNLNQIIYLLIPSLLTQYIIRLIYSAKASQQQSETHLNYYYQNDQQHAQNHHQTAHLHQSQHDHPNQNYHDQQLHYQQYHQANHHQLGEGGGGGGGEPVAAALTLSQDQQETAAILSMINHVFAFVTFLYFILLLVSLH